MYKKHPDLHIPQQSQVIWHYFSLSKFLGFIDGSSIYLCRHDKFDDGFEGSLSVMDKRYFDRMNPGLHEYITGDKMGCFYYNCWTQSDIDEYVLWNTYASLQDGIAVRSTVERLIGSLDVDKENDVYISDVQYIDYSKDYTFRKTGGVVNILAPHFTKRDYFASEKELRVMHVNPTGKFDTSPKGIEVRVDLQKLIDKVYVAPFSFEWLKTVIANILKKYGLDSVEVVRSSI